MITLNERFVLRMVLDSQLKIEIAVLKKLHKMSQRHDTVACADLIEVTEARIDEIKRQADEL